MLCYYHHAIAPYFNLGFVLDFSQNGNQPHSLASIVG